MHRAVAVRQPGEHEQVLRLRAERDVTFRAADHVVVTLPAERRCRGGGVEVEARLDDRRRPGLEALAAKGGEQPAFQLGRPELEERHRQEARREEVGRDRQIAVREFLGDDGTGERRMFGAEPPVLLGDHVLDEAEIPAALQQRGGNAALLVRLARVWTDFVARESDHGLANELLLVVELEIDHWDSLRCWRTPRFAAAT